MVLFCEKAGYHGYPLFVKLAAVQVGFVSALPKRVCRISREGRKPPHNSSAKEGLLSV